MPLISLPAVRLHVDEFGTGQPVLMLHGLGSSGADWDRVIPGLAAEPYRLIVPDTRGHGRSDKPDGAYGVALFAADIAALCDAMNLEKLHVVGLSMGGMIAFQLAVTRPDLVRSLTIVNSGPDMVPRTLKMKLALGFRLFLTRTLGPRRLAKWVVKRLFPKPEQKALRAELGDRLGANDPDVYLRSTRGLMGWTVLNRLAEISCPVLILASDRDYTPVAMKRDYAARLQNAQVVVIEDSGHASPADQPQKVIAALIPFLRSQGESRARGKS